IRIRTAPAADQPPRDLYAAADLPPPPVRVMPRGWRHPRDNGQRAAVHAAAASEARCRTRAVASPGGKTDRKDKATRVQAMFGRIAPRYDLMNRLMTGGRDQAWRRAAARAAAPPRGTLALDLATGTGDLAHALLAEARVRGVIGVDFVEGMLRLGRAKAEAAGERRGGAPAPGRPAPPL